VPPDALTPADIDRFVTNVARLADPPLPDRPLALAVSGGPDSMAMLALAAAAFPAGVIAATVDHRLRADATAEAAMVAGWCTANGVPHATLAPDEPPAGASIQAQARRVRYRLLGDWALAAGAGALATAHHADDQAETFLMRAARGSGPGGLAGIRRRWDYAPEHWSAPRDTQRPPGALAIIRPLLDWRRSDLRTIAAALPFVDDPSNHDPRHDRTAIRALLARGDFDPVALATAATHCAEADAALAHIAQDLWTARATLADDGSCHLDVGGLPRDLHRRLARRAIGHVRAATGVTEGFWSDSVNIDAIMATSDHAKPSTQAGIRVSAKDGTWHFRPAPARRSS
jgi:tRNA(Ile)-lysidine synthase